MKNPFKQYLPPEEPDQDSIESEIMSSIYLKSYMAAILEFFLGILGLAATDSLSAHSENDIDSNDL